MRRCRINLPNRCYHLISRVAHRAYFLDEGERTRLVDFVRRVAEFSGVKLLAYSVMSNHFHVFVNIGRPEPLSDAEIVRRYRASFLRRMWNASEFMKTLKQRYTMSFNGRRDHHGTMLESRYRVRVKDPAECGMMLAESGYVDANPVNAGIVDWPDGYEWCSCAAACRGDETARSGYDFVYGGKGRPWSELEDFIKRTEDALALIQEKSPRSYAIVTNYLRRARRRTTSSARPSPSAWAASSATARSRSTATSSPTRRTPSTRTAAT